MPFFQVDDQFPVNRKAIRLVEMVLRNDLRGLAALSLWMLAGAHSQASGSDGVVTATDLIRLLLDKALADELAHLLVAAGLWHPAGHDCSRCPDVAAGSFVFHDWFALGYDPAEKVRETRARRKELKTPDIVEAVWARDAIDPADPTVAACRYCGRIVNRNDHRSAYRPTLDHVDPTEARGVRNLVVACGECNRRKGRRTPAQAGMKLLPAPRPTPEDPANQTFANPVTPNHDPTGNQLGPDRVSGVSAYARDRAGAWQGQGKVSGQGDQQGEAGSGEVTRSKRRRRRGRGRPPGQRAGPLTDAGAAPEVRTAGQFGSPWHNWTGPPSPISAESVCPEHGLDEPCRKCPRGDQ